MTLEQEYKDYRAGKKTKKDFLDDVIEYVYIEIGKNRKIEPGDFIVEFIPKAETLLLNYIESKCSFTHYINNNIKWGILSFSKRYIEHIENQYAYQHYSFHEFDNLEIADHTPSYNISPAAKKVLTIDNGEIERQILKKRLKIFALKNAKHLNDEQINLLAPLIETSPEWLIESINRLQEECKNKNPIREYQQHRYNRLFMSIIKDQCKILQIDDKKEKEKLKNSIALKQRRKEILYMQMINRRSGPKNEDIAKLLGIPKGTVDSSLFYMKKHLNTLLK